MGREWADPPARVDDAPKVRESWPAWAAWWGSFCALVVGQAVAITLGLFVAGKALRGWWPNVPPLAAVDAFGLAAGVLMVFYALVAFNRIVRTGNE